MTEVVKTEEERRESETSSGGSTQPRTFEIRLRTVGIVVVSLVAAAAIGAGSYFFGRTTGEDLGAARSAGAKAGRIKGTANGAAKGYAEGFSRGKATAFNRAYPRAYKRSYAQAFEGSELTVPTAKDIAVPKP